MDYLIKALGHVQGGRADPIDDDWGTSRSVIALDGASEPPTIPTPARAEGAEALPFFWRGVRKGKKAFDSLSCLGQLEVVPAVPNRRIANGRSRFVALFGLVIGLSSCLTAPRECVTGGALAQLRCNADQGDKSAQLALGIAYETGGGVEQNFSRAARLYRRAADFTDGTLQLYVPAAGKAPALVRPVRVGPDRAGLPEAMLRLARLYEQGLGVTRNIERAAALRRRAAKAVEDNDGA